MFWFLELEAHIATGSRAPRNLFPFIPTTPYCPPGVPPPSLGAYMSILGCLGTSALSNIRVMSSVSPLHFLNKEFTAHFPGRRLRLIELKEPNEGLIGLETEHSSLDRWFTETQESWSLSQGLPQAGEPPPWILSFLQCPQL